MTPLCVAVLGSRLGLVEEVDVLVVADQMLPLPLLLLLLPPLLSLQLSLRRPLPLMLLVLMLMLSPQFHVSLFWAVASVEASKSRSLSACLSMSVLPSWRGYRTRHNSVRLGALRATEEYSWQDASQDHKS